MVFHGDQARGVSSRIVFGEETTYGSAALESGGYELPLTSDAIQNNINTFESEIIRTDRGVAQIREGNFRPDGDINTELIVSELPTLLKHALGVYTEPTLGDVSSNQQSAARDLVYDHTLYGSFTSESTLANAGGLQPASRATNATTATSLTIEKQFEFPGASNPEISLLYTGCRFNRVGITVPTEGIATVSLGFLGANEELRQTGSIDTFHFDSFTTATTDPDLLGLSPFTSFDTSVELGDAADSPSWSSLDKVQSFDMTLENNIFGDNFILGQRGRANLLEGRRRVTGTMQMLFLSDDEFYNFVLNSATNPKALRFTFSQNSAFTTPAARIRITLRYVKFVGAPATPVIPGEGPISVTVPFQAYHGSTATTDPAQRDIEVEIRNGNARI